MRKIAANMIFTLTGQPLKNSYLVLDNEGVIMDVVNTNGQLNEIASLEYYNGILVPGFIVETTQKTLPYSLNYYWNKGIQAMVTTEFQQPSGKPALIQMKIEDISDNINPLMDILNQIREIQQFESEQSFEQILKLFTIEKAKELQIDHQFGSFSLGLKPGVLLIYPFDFKELRLTNTSKVQRLM